MKYSNPLDRKMKLSLTIIAIGIGQVLLAQNKIENLESCQRDSIDGMKIHAIVENPPEYKGGIKQFYDDFSRNVKFPKSDRSHYLQLYVSFVIDTVGNIRNFCADPGFVNHENLVEIINNWTPGIQKGKKVPVRMLLPINIRLD